MTPTEKLAEDLRRRLAEVETIRATSDETEAAIVAEALKTTGGHVTRAAELLGRPPAWLHGRLRPKGKLAKLNDLVAVDGRTKEQRQLKGH